MEDNTIKDAVICDLSGTLFRTDNTPNPPVVALIHAMKAQGHMIVFLTGIRQKHRAHVEARLDALGLKPSIDANIVLFMRGANDTRAPLTFKQEVLIDHIYPSNVLFALDDTPTILRMYAKHGIPTMQVRI